MTSAVSRRFVTSGIALVGAGAIVAAPVAPPPDVHVPAMQAPAAVRQVTAPVNLTAVNWPQPGAILAAGANYLVVNGFNVLNVVTNATFEVAEPILAIPLEVGGATVGAIGALIQNPQNAAAIVENYANIVLESVVVAPAEAVQSVLPSLEQTFFTLGEGLFIIGLASVEGAFSVIGAGVGGAVEIVFDTINAIPKVFQGDFSGAINEVVTSVETNATDFVNTVTEAQKSIVEALVMHTPATAAPATTVAPAAPVAAAALTEAPSDEATDPGTEAEAVQPAALTKVAEEPKEESVNADAVADKAADKAADKGAAPKSANPGDSIKKSLKSLGKKLRAAAPKPKAKADSKESKAKAADKKSKAEGSED